MVPRLVIADHRPGEFGAGLPTPPERPTEGLIFGSNPGPDTNATRRPNSDRHEFA